jgi:hypothetical protein
MLSRNHLPYETLAFMKENKIIISGSVALDLLEPNCVVPNDVDFFVPAGTLDAMEAFLKDRTNFVKRAKPAHGLDFGDTYVRVETGKWVSGSQRFRSDSLLFLGIREVLYYVHPSWGTVVNVIESNFPVPTPTIFKFHTTFVMNYISHNAVVSAYPNMTCDRVGLVNTQADAFSRKLVRCLIKYALRGFKFLDRVYDWHKEAHDCKTYGYCARSKRSVNDKYTMRLCFNDGIGSVPDIINENVTWRLGSRFDCTEQKGQFILPGVVVIP